MHLISMKTACTVSITHCFLSVTLITVVVTLTMIGQGGAYPAAITSALTIAGHEMLSWMFPVSGGVPVG